MNQQTEKSQSIADFTHWPVVVAQMPAFNQQRSQQLLDALDAALSRNEPFAVVADMAAYITHPHESPEEKKASALWLKHNRDRFFKHCRGTVYLLQDDEARAALLESGRKQAKATGLPVEAAASLHEAIALARTFLE
ncbi:MAG TPA: hypothetical protein DD979_18500 [Gammaproteobacteria bacterium]|jgi:hypothetical protein|nr:hypothetical protein [Gammaproteobacteria bacterium]